MTQPMFLLLLGLLFAAPAFAQKTPPQAVLDAFNQKFPGKTDVDWEKEKNGVWEAEFDEGTAEWSASFSAGGQWLETEMEIPPAELPAAVKAAVQGKKIREAAKILRADGSTVYEVEMRGKELLFNGEGKAL